MASSSEENHDSARIQILESAIRQCAENGWNRLTIRTIAAAAKVNSALLGYYYTNKDTLAREVIRLTLHRLGESRRGMLAQLHREHGEVIPIDILLRAYAEPFMQTAHPLRNEMLASLSITAHLLGNPQEPLATYGRSINRQFSMMYIEEIARSGGYHDKETLYVRFEMMLGSLVFICALTNAPKDIAFFSHSAFGEKSLLDRFAQDWSSIFSLGDSAPVARAKPA